MAIQVDTRDCAALSDADLDEMASMGGAFDIGNVSKAKEDWVLSTCARNDGELHGFMFSTLERIGGTPCVLFGLVSVKRDDIREKVLNGLMHEAFHRALMAFPDEDVVIGSRFIYPDSLAAYALLTDLIPRHGHRAVGEERAWGRRLAKRFGVDAHYDEQAFVVAKNGQSGFLDYESNDRTDVDADVAALFANVNPKKGGALIVHGWSMAEDLLKIGAR